MTTTIEIEDESGSIDTFTHLGHAVDYKFGEMDIMSVDVPRDEVNNVDPTEVVDTVSLKVDGNLKFRGPLEEIVRGGPTVELIVNSPEQWGVQAQPTGPAKEYEHYRSDFIINETIYQKVPEWSVGDTDVTRDDISLLFSYASPAYKVRKVEASTEHEVKFHPDGSVDFVDKIGNDHSDIVLSPANQNLEEDVEVTRRGQREYFTHLLVLGAGEGVHQIACSFVPANDPVDYQQQEEFEWIDEYETYLTSEWEEGDERIWYTFPEKSASNARQLKSVGESLIDEVEERVIEADVVVRDEEVELGDRYTIEIPDENLSKVLRAVEVTWIHDAKGERWNVLFSSRQKTRVDPQKKLHGDTENYNLAVQGVAVPINASGGRQPVDSNNNYTLQLYYPDDVLQETRLNLRVVGLPYRAYSQGSADNTNEDVVEQASDVFVNSTTISILGDGWTKVGEYSFTEDASAFEVTANGEYESITDTDFHVATLFRLVDQQTGEVFPKSLGTASWVKRNSSNDVSESQIWQAHIPVSPMIGDGTWDVEMAFTSKFGANANQYTWDGEFEAHSIGRHTHDPSPGIIEFDDNYPLNADVIINDGFPEGYNLGDGSTEFSASLDITGELAPGQFNSIQVTSDKTCHMQVYVEGDIYRQIIGGG